MVFLINMNFSFPSILPSTHKQIIDCYYNTDSVPHVEETYKIRTRLGPQGVDNPTQRDFENYLKGDEAPQGNFKQANDCILVIYCCLIRTSKLSSSKQQIFIIL